MRTLLILATIGTLAAAEAPKPTPTLSATERTALGSIIEKSQKLAAEQKQYGEQFEIIRKEICQRAHKQDACTITEQGQIIATPAPAEKVEKK